VEREGVRERRGVGRRHGGGDAARVPRKRRLDAVQGGAIVDAALQGRRAVDAAVQGLVADALHGSASIEELFCV
jgi:hypothetical protein